MSSDSLGNRSGDFDEVLDTGQILGGLGGELDLGRVALVQLGVNLVGALGPDATTTALGQFLEIGAAGSDGRGDRLILQEEPLQGLAGGLAADGLADLDLNRRSGLKFLGHSFLSFAKEGGSIANFIPWARAGIHELKMAILRIWHMFMRINGLLSIKVHHNMEKV